ncbi:hypothetical protein [Nocardioides sp. YIM 152588]|uniref:hypothetical protein n=1 Tax=Nocardioides sp. YIM 152588 TaxID=3158259 RepID=UPI0032E4565B
MTAFDNIVRALLHTGVKVTRVTDGRARAQCPAHDSRGFTLSLRALDDRAVVHCFAGCEDVAVLDAIGLSVRDLFDEARGDRPSYTPPRPASPWDEAMRSIGLRTWPPVDHVLDRMVVEQERSRPGGDPLGAA